MTITRDALDLTIQDPLSPGFFGNGTPLYRDPRPWDLTVQNPPPEPDMFKLVQLGPHCTRTPPHMFKLVYYEARTVGNRRFAFY